MTNKERTTEAVNAAWQVFEQGNADEADIETGQTNLTALRAALVADIDDAFPGVLALCDALSALYKEYETDPDGFVSVALADALAKIGYETPTEFEEDGDDE